MRHLSTKRTVLVPASAFLAALAFGCDHAESDAMAPQNEIALRATVDGGSDSSAVDAGGPAVDEPAVIELSDNQIYGVLVAHHEAELAQTARAQEKVGTPAVLAFARQLAIATDAAQAREASLGRLTSLTAEESDQSVYRTRVSTDVLQIIEDVPAGPNLDMQYAFAEAMVHAHLVEQIDTVLAVQADNALLKTELRTVRRDAQRRAAEAGALVQTLTPPDETEAAPEDEGAAPEDAAETAPEDTAETAPEGDDLEAAPEGTEEP